MRHFNSLSLSALGFASLSRAQWWLQNYTEATIPWVDYDIKDYTDFFEYPATLLGSSGAESTYGVFCSAETTSLCFGLEGWTSMTLVTSPKTMNIEFNDVTEYATTGCTLTGTPFPTTGTCSETYTSANGTSITGIGTTYTVPYTSTNEFDGYVLSENVYTATFDVLEATTTQTSKTTSTKSSGSSSSTPTSNSKSSGGSGTSPTGSGTATHNAAMITGAPSWILLAGAIAGAAVGV